jgi:hypothetical protein
MPELPEPDDAEVRRIIQEAADRLFGPPQHTPVPEPVPKDIQGEFVQAEHDLMWLAEHGRLHIVALFLASLRSDTEYQESH